MATLAAVRADPRASSRFGDVVPRAGIDAATPTAGTQPDFVAPPHALERLVLVALDIGAVNLAFYLAWFARYRLGLRASTSIPGNYVEHEVYLPLQIALSLTFAFILALRGLYRLPRAASALDDLSTIFTAAGSVGDAAVRRLDVRPLPGRVAPDADLRLGPDDRAGRRSAERSACGCSACCTSAALAWRARWSSATTPSVA